MLPNASAKRSIKETIAKTKQHASGMSAYFQSEGWIKKNPMPLNA
jgi:hypothetical protein